MKREVKGMEKVKENVKAKAEMVKDKAEMVKDKRLNILSPTRKLGMRHRGRLLVAVPPLGPACEDLFAETCFQVVDPRGKRVDGELLHYGDEVLLLDEEGM